MKKTKENQGTSQRMGVFAMRFDPRVKYLAELAARRERRSLTNFVEWAIDQALQKVVLIKGTGDHFDISPANAADLLWDIDEVERLSKLHGHCPDLLSYDEQRLMDVVEHFSVSDGNESFRTGRIINWPLVKRCWVELKSFVLDEGDRNDLIAAIKANA